MIALDVNRSEYVKSYNIFKKSADVGRKIKKVILPMILVGASLLAPNLAQANRPLINNAMMASDFITRQLTLQRNGINGDRRGPAIDRANILEFERNLDRDLTDLEGFIRELDRTGAWQQMDGGEVNRLMNTVRLANDVLADGIETDAANLARGADVDGPVNRGPFDNRMKVIAQQLGERSVAALLAAGVAVNSVVTNQLTPNQVALGVGGGLFAAGAIINTVYNGLTERRDFRERQDAAAQRVRRFHTRIGLFAGRMIILNETAERFLRNGNRNFAVEGVNPRSLFNNIRRTRLRWADTNGNGVSLQIMSTAIEKFIREERANDRGQ